MPVISRFFGIEIRMYYREHGVPHFHAEYQGQRASFDVDGKILSGWIRSRSARSRIKQWSLARRDEVLANWERARAGEELEPIAPVQ